MILNNLKESRTWVERERPYVPDPQIVSVMLAGQDRYPNTPRSVPNSNLPASSAIATNTPRDPAKNNESEQIANSSNVQSIQRPSAAPQRPSFPMLVPLDSDLIDTSKLPRLKRQSTLDERVSKKIRADLPLKDPLQAHEPHGPPDTSVSRLQEYIRILEEKNTLLLRWTAVSDSTSLSQDAKNNWRDTKFRPRLRDIDARQGQLRQHFLFLQPEPQDLSKLLTSEETSDAVIADYLDNAVISMGLPVDAKSPPILHFPENAISSVGLPAGPKSPPILNFSNFANLPDLPDVDGPEEADMAVIPGTASYDTAVPGTTPRAPVLLSSQGDDPVDDASENLNTQANREEARRIVMANKARAPNFKNSNASQADDEEDEFGEGFMDGLKSSQLDDNDTDLSGFIASDRESGDESLDGTYMLAENTRHDADSDGDDAQVQATQPQNIREEVRGLILSQDVASRFGVKYDDILDAIEVSDEENDPVDGGFDFTTQLNENRDEVVEILSEDDDLDDADVSALTELLHVKLESQRQPPKLTILTVNDSDFSDDDDELIQLSKTVGSSKQDKSSRTVPAGLEPFIDEVYEVLMNSFNLALFRPNQLEAVVATLQGKDVFVLIPTGGGKSLCYQLPALVNGGHTSGITVVISPLISLMQDQVQHLLAKNIRAGMISSKGSTDERNLSFRQLALGQLDLVYLSPEMVNNSVRVQKVIAKLHENGMLARIVVDEAHCVSSWGHDFRPDYKGMSMFKQQYPSVPIMALTATANEKVRLDIVHHLRMHNPVLLKQSFNRTNLFYEVRSKPSGIYEWVRDYIVNHQANRTGIIYCHSKNSCEVTASKLNSYGILCMFYHAGMDPDERFEVQTHWQQNRIQLICATIAFGMGIDKPDVRFVIHMYIPRSLEGYYQETGRAGRDGKPSQCIMFYSYKDARSLQSLIQRDDKLEEDARDMHLAKLRQVVQYCENKTDCRRRQVLHFFNETFDPKLCRKQCDNCCSEVVSEMRDVTDHCYKIMQLVQRIQSDKVTVMHCQDAYKGSKSNKIVKLGHHENPYHGGGKELDRADIERIFFYLQSESCLLEYQVMKGGFASTYVKLGPNAKAIIDEKRAVTLSFATKATSSSSSASSIPRPRLEATGKGPGTLRPQESFRSARDLREEQEKENWRPGNDISEFRRIRSAASAELGYGQPAFFVSDDALREMAEKLPTNQRDFAKLVNVSKEQASAFPHFKKLLTSLARQRKKSAGDLQTYNTQPSGNGNERLSPYFQSNLLSYIRPKQQRTQGSQSQRHRRSQSNRRSNKPRGNSQRAQPQKKPTGGMGNIFLMPI